MKVAPALHLISTKLQPPRLSRDLIHRPQLMARLDRGLSGKLILISAPAGFGKTTLVNQWLQQTAGEQGGRGAEEKFSLAPLLPRSPARVAWLSLDENDNDLAHFMSYVVAAIGTTFPGHCAQTRALLQASQLPPVEVLATSLLNDMADLPEAFILVLEDYHYIRNKAIHQLLSSLLEYLSAQVSLALTTRQDPPFPLARLRARQELVEIRSNDLRFTAEEVQAYLEGSLGARPAPEVVALLAERTEGWAAGLQMAVLALRNQAAPVPFLEAFQGSYRYIMEYLLDEVLSQQPQAVQAFLLQIAVLDRFCAPLVAALLKGPHPNPLPEGGEGTRGVRDILRYLEETNLFIVPLDQSQEWYRYHHLLQELLVYKLKLETSPAAIAALHARAGAWLAEQGFVEEALRHLLAAGDSQSAAQLVEESRHELLNRDEWRPLERWLALLPPELIWQRPGLLLTWAWVLQIQFNLGALPPLLEAAAGLLADPALLPATRQLLQAELDFMWGIIWYFQNKGQRSFDHFQRILPQISGNYRFFRGQVIGYFCLAAQMTGQRDRVLPVVTEAFQAEVAPPAMLTVQLLLAQIMVHLLAGELGVAAELAQQLLSLAEHHHFANRLAWSHYLLGHVAYARNELEAAAAHLAEAVRLRYTFQSRGALDSLAALALTYQARQQPDKVQETLTLLQQFALESQNPAYLRVARSCQARLWLGQGDLEAASGWLQTAGLASATGGYLFFLELARFTTCRVLIAQGAAASLQQAGSRLQDYLQTAEATHNTRQMIEILILQAAAYGKGDQREAALAALEGAIHLARPGGFIRPFVEADPPVADLLRELAQSGVAPTYLSQILAAFENDELGRMKDELQKIHPSSFSPQPLIDPLTDRELEVLYLLSRHQSNPEIARALHVSISTVKTHTHRIYQKLDAKNRHQAVRKARTLHLL